MQERHKRTIAYVTGTRADFGLMSAVLRAIAHNAQLRLQLYATGMHLQPQFGSTVRAVRRLYPKTKIIQATYGGDSRTAMAQFTGAFLQRIVTALAADKPDFVLTLGDRAEMLCTALACTYLGIPSGQLHGGEKTATVDETARHAITKLSHLHFPATRAAATRIRALGEEPWRIHVVGAPALDVILHEKLPSRAAVCRFTGLDPKRPFLLVTQHPVSEELQDAARHMRATLAAVRSFGMPAVVTYPNADAGGRAMIREIERERNNPLFRIFPNIGYPYFLALEREAAAWLGNSSAGMIESASFHTPVINIGTRQRGRERGTNVLDVPYTTAAIRNATHRALHDLALRQRIRRGKNPWGNGDTSRHMIHVLQRLPARDTLLNKRLTYA